MRSIVLLHKTDENVYRRTDYNRKIISWICILKRRKKTVTIYADQIIETYGRRFNDQHEAHPGANILRCSAGKNQATMKT